MKEFESDFIKRINPQTGKTEVADGGELEGKPNLKTSSSNPQLTGTVFDYRTAAAKQYQVGKMTCEEAAGVFI